MCFHKSHLNGLWGCKIPVWPLEMITLFSFPLWLSLQEQQFHANGEPKSIKRLPSERRIRLLLYYWYIHSTYILGWLPFCILQTENKIRTWWKEKYEYPNLPESFSMPKVHCWLMDKKTAKVYVIGEKPKKSKCTKHWIFRQAKNKNDKVCHHHQTFFTFSIFKKVLLLLLFIVCVDTKIFLSRFLFVIGSSLPAP